MPPLSAADIEQARLDPESVFRSPEEVIRAALSVKDKKAVLRRWEEDTEALIRASDEGMEPSETRRSPADLLGAIQDALELLEGDGRSA